MRIPPYGTPSQQLQSPSNSEPMRHWREDRPAFDDFIKKVGDVIETWIWPSYNKTSGEWEGQSAQTALKMTEAELNISVEEMQKVGLLFRNADTPHHKLPLLKKSHKWHYEVEDLIVSRGQRVSEFEGNASLFPMSNFVYYDNSVVPDAMREHFISGAANKYQGTFQLKLRFQRPRPQQMAYMLNIDDFRWYQARSYTHTGNHPALISGHCAQGLLISASLLERRLDQEKETDIDVESLAQFSVDFGDRRVFAGVHYPTDNVASWITVLRLCDNVFENGKYFKEFFAKAITQKSTVFKIIQEEFPKYPEMNGVMELIEKEILSLV